MELINKTTIVAEIPLFSSLTPEDHQFISELATFAEYKKGKVVYAQGAAADAFFCILVGRVVVHAQDPSGKKQILEYLHRGKYFGIISLLTGDPHSVTAQALNDSTLLVIKKEDFDAILVRVPQLAIDLSRTLSRRLKRKDIHPKTIFESTIISVFSSYSQAGKSVYALNLSLSMRKETHKAVIVVDICPEDKKHTLPERLGITHPYKVFNLSAQTLDSELVIKDHIMKDTFGIDLLCFYYRPDDESVVKKLMCVLTLLVNEYHYIILDLPSVIDTAILSILNQSDLIHVLTGPESDEVTCTRQLIQRLTCDFGFHEEKIKIIVNGYNLLKQSSAQDIQIPEEKIFAILPKIDFKGSERITLDCPSCEYASVVRRVSREVGESFVGLVLGVGAGYGFCHIGVLRVLEEEKIPIDIVAGASIGSLIASLWVTGKSSAEILEITKEFREPKHLWNLLDFTFPTLGFLKGNKLYQFLKKHLGDKTFYDTRIPLKIVASDVRSKESRVLDKGPLADAVMASCSMPGVFTPFKLKEEMLFDGGVTNPLPTDPLFKLGVKKIIAVDVTPSREDILRQKELLKSGKGPIDSNRSKGFLFREYLHTAFKTNILDIVFSSVEMLQSEVARKEALLADIVLHPDTTGLYWLDLHKAEEFARRGEFEARRNLDRIWQIVNE